MRISRSKFLDVRRIKRKEFQALFPCGDSERVHVYISPCGRRLTNRPHSLKRNRLAERARSPIMRPSRLNRADCWRIFRSLAAKGKDRKNAIATTHGYTKPLRMPVE